MASGLTPPTAPEPVARTPWQRWVGFWFPASDPTTLGFIRLATGLLVLYIHLAYSVNLTQFFGKTSWYAQRFMDRERLEYPWQVSPFFDWDPQSIVSAKLPDFPHRRKAVVDFIKALPAEEARRNHALRFLDRLAKADGPEAPLQTLGWFSKMGMSEAERDRFLAALVAGPPQGAVPRDSAYYYRETPAILFALPPAERERLADEVRSFWAVLPKDPTDRAYVLEHLTELPQEIRRAYAEFLLTLPEDEKAREKRIDYLEYWNNQPEKVIRTGNAIFSVWFHVTDPTWMAVVHVGVLAVIVMFTLGLFTRVTSVLAWLAVVGYIHRTQQVLFGMDTMMNILMFYLMIGNSGAALSVDRLIARYRAARASLRRAGTIDAPARAFLAFPPPSRSAGFGLRLIQVHFCFIYVAAGLSKLKGAAWWNGTATWDVFVNPEFTLLNYHWYEGALRHLVSVKPIYYSMIIGGAWFTLFIEIAGPFLLWTRLRWLVIFLASLMHAMIAVMMGLNLFEPLMIVMILAFLPDGVVRDRLRGAAGAARLAFGFNPASAPSARAAALVAAADTDGQVALAPEPGLAAPAVTDPDGRRHTGREGVGVLFRSVRLLSALGFVLWVPGLKGLFARWLFPGPASAAPPSSPPPPAAPKPPAPAAAS
jgi:hypothetical protein